MSSRLLMVLKATSARNQQIGLPNGYKLPISEYACRFRLLLEYFRKSAAGFGERCGYIS